MHMKLGYVGLGKMGKNMVLNLLTQGGFDIVAWNRSPEPRKEVADAGATAVETLDELVASLEAPRAIWLMLPAGDVTDAHLKEIAEKLEPGDLVIDGGNSFYKDTLRRAEELQEKGIHFMDIGTSGGPTGALKGACMMIGGTKEDYEKILPLVKAASAPDAYQLLGPVGSGHFAKMVHNGIEYGMMQAIAEGAGILKKSEFGFDMAQVFDLYNHQSVVTSRLVGWLEEALVEDPELAEYNPVIGHTGEGEWTVKTAEEVGVPVPVIKESFRVRVNSEEDVAKDPEAVAYRNQAVSAMRGKFGGHSVKK